MDSSAEKIQTYTEEDYYKLPKNVHAELIDGIFIYNQAAPSRKHQGILIRLCTAIQNYIDKKGGNCKVYPAPFAVKLWDDKNTIVEPDISIICDEEKLTDRGCTGAPDWIIEIASPSNSKHDYITKLNLYTEAGVREYWIIDPEKERILVYFPIEERCELSIYSFQDIIKTNIYPDLSIDFKMLDI